MIRSRQQFWTIAGISLLALVGFLAIVISRAITTLPTGLSPTHITDIPVNLTDDGAPLIGNPQAALTVVEFLDYSCYHCATSQPTINALLKEHVATGKVQLEIRILSGLDPVGSATAARAALCAGEQNAFLTMHLELLALQLQYGRNAFTLEHIQSASGRLGLDANALIRCTQNQRSFQTVLNNTANYALATNIQTMPTFLLQTNEGVSLIPAGEIDTLLSP
ncbi:DsbA family protein [Chloroflexota bacterium]